MSLSKRYLSKFKEGVEFAVVSSRPDWNDPVTGEDFSSRMKARTAKKTPTPDESHLVEVILDYLTDLGLPDRYLVEQATQHEVWIASLPYHQGVSLGRMALVQLAGKGDRP